MIGNGLGYVKRELAPIDLRENNLRFQHFPLDFSFSPIGTPRLEAHDHVGTHCFFTLTPVDKGERG